MRGHAIAHVLLHRAAADHELLSDGSVAAALGHQLQHLVLAGLVIRKPGAALYGELVAASVSALAGFATSRVVRHSG